MRFIEIVSKIVRLQSKAIRSLSYCPSYGGVRFIMCPLYRDSIVYTYLSSYFINIKYVGQLILVHPPLVLDYFSSFSNKTSWKKSLTKKIISSQMLFVTKHEQTYQVAVRMIRDHKFHIKLNNKQRCLDKPVNVLL